MGRTEKSIRNLVFAVAAQAVTVALSFITRTCLIYCLGIEAVAINGLFTEVITALSLAELGVGSAIVYNLYKPLSEGDHQKVSQLMNLFRKAYRVIALGTLVIGVSLTPWIQFFIKDLPYDINYVRVIYLMFVFQSAVSYLFSYKIALLEADQNAYIYTRISTIFRIVGTAIILVILVATKRYIIFLGTNILLVIATNAYASHVVNEKYPYLEKKERLPKEERAQIFSNIRNIFVKQFAGRVVDSTDNILISTLVSTLLVGYYSNYLVVIGVFKQLAAKMMSAAMASMGNLFATERTTSKVATLTRLTFIFYVFASVASVGTFACIQPFIKLWLGEKYLLDYAVVAILCLLLVTEITYKPLSSAMHLSGYFVIGRNISFVSALVNLAVSIVLGKKIGLIGIFIGTMCTYTIEIITKVHYLFKLYFKEDSFRYVCFWLKMLLVFIVEMITVYIVNLHLSFSALPAFVFNGFLSILLTFVMITLVFGKSDAYLYSKQLIIRYTKKVFRRDEA